MKKKSKQENIQLQDYGNFMLALVAEVEKLRESLRQAHEVIDRWAQGNKNFQTDNEHLRAELAAERERCAGIAFDMGGGIGEEIAVRIRDSQPTTPA